MASNAGLDAAVDAAVDASVDAEIDAEIVVIGAGVVGLAVAERLAARRSVVVVERHESFGRETSAHNSGIVHAGLLYVAGSLKHLLCVEGNALLYRWCEAHSVRVRRTGKLIVALAPGEVAALDALWEQARANDVPGMRRFTAEQARACEPLVPAVAGLYSESSGVVDQWGLARSLEAAARERGALIAYRHEVLGVSREGGGFRLLVRGEDGEESTVRCTTLVNSAGHGAPQLAASLGYPLDGGMLDGVAVPVLRQRVNRGRYYDVVGERYARAVSRPVYPVPARAADVIRYQAEAGGAGVYLSVDIDGAVHLGPDTEWLDDGVPLDYRSDDGRRDLFLAAGRRLLPDLGRDDIAPGQVGYRPKLDVPDDEPPDFLVWADRGYLHLGGIESPALTACLALARVVEERLA